MPCGSSDRADFLENSRQSDLERQGGQVPFITLFLRREEGRSDPQSPQLRPSLGRGGDSLHGDLTESGGRVAAWPQPQVCMEDSGIRGRGEAQPAGPSGALAGPSHCGALVLRLYIHRTGMFIFPY